MADQAILPADREEEAPAVEITEITAGGRTFDAADLEYVKTIILQDLEDARDYMEAAKLERVRNFQAYYTKPYGNERPGLSTYVEPTIKNTINAIMPSLLRIFLAGDELIEIKGRNPEDDDSAAIMGEIVDWQLQVLNDGFFLFHDSFWDALLWPNGYIETGWHKIVEPKRVEKMSVDEFVSIRNDPGFEIYEFEPIQTPRYIEATTQPDEFGELQIVEEEQIVLETTGFRNVHYGEVLKNQPVAECFHPAQFLLEKGQTSIQNANFAAREYTVSFSHLKAQEKTSDNPAGIYFNLDVLARSLQKASGNRQDDEYRQELPLRESHMSRADIEPSPLDLGRQQIEVARCWPKLDLAGTGEGKRYLAEIAGGQTLIRFEELPFDHGEVPVVSLVSSRVPHQHHGIGYGTDLDQIQQLMTAMTRQLVDNMAWSNVGFWKGEHTAGIDLADLSGLMPRSIVFVNKLNQLERVAPDYFGDKALPVLNYFDDRTEKRTGVTAYNQGTDSESLNKTARGISMILNQAQQHIEMIARLLAESFKPVVRHFVSMNQQFLDKAQQFRLQNREAPIIWDPDRMKFKYDLIAHVGVGTGNQQQRLQDAQYILELILKNVQLLTAWKMLTPENVYNAIEDAFKQVGKRDASRYVTKPAQQQAIENTAGALAQPEQGQITEGQ